MSEGYRHSHNVIGFGGEEVERSANRLGYDATEVGGEPKQHDPRQISPLKRCTFPYLRW